MPTTSPDGIYYPDRGVADRPSVYLNTLATSVQTALSKKIDRAATPPMTLRGTMAQRAATTALYWQMWVDTNGSQTVWVGDRSGKWRQYCGTRAFAAGPWGFTNLTALIAARNITFQIPGYLESDETLLISATNTGSGFGLVTLQSTARSTGNIETMVRQVQLGSLAQNPCSIAWQIVKKTA